MKKFFDGKRVLITGHTGFKGTWLVALLKYLGSDISGFSLPNSKTRFYESVQSHIRDHYGDIRDKKELTKIVKMEKPEIIIHLASHSTVNQGKDLTHYIFETNAMGVVNLFEAVREVPSVRTVLIVTSDKCYRNLEMDRGYTEDYGFGAQDPYSASKAIQELITECYRNLICRDEGRDVKITSARASNVIGGGDFNRSRLFPYLIDCGLKNKTAIIRNPNAIRPWQNVIDVLSGYLKLVMKASEGEYLNRYCSAFNFGPEPNSFVSVREIVDMIQEEFPNLSYQISGENSVTETKVLKLDSSKAKKLLDWQPKFSLNDTISMTCEFEKQFNSGCSAKDICKRYITNYFER